MMEEVIQMNKRKYQLVYNFNESEEDQGDSINKGIEILK